VADRTDFLVGATIVLVVNTLDPATRAPTDPAGGVALDAVIQTNVTPHVPATPVGSPVFTSAGEGKWIYRLDTTGMAPGVYTWRAKALDATLGTALREDTFVLRAVT
jgi:hypothetical protein